MERHVLSWMSRKESKVMSSRCSKATLYVILLGCVLGVMMIQPAAGQDLKELSRPRTVSKATSLRAIPNGEKITLEGNVIRAEGDTFSVCDMAGGANARVLRPST